MMRVILMGVITWLFLLTVAVYNYTNNVILILPEFIFVQEDPNDSLDEDVSSIFYLTTPIKLSQEDIYCLQRNVYFEAGIEPYEGKLAVAQVTLNRLESGRWGHSVCSVVFARAQFSWTLWKKKRTKVPSGPLWEETKVAVRDFKNGIRLRDLDTSLHYHADYIETPWWADTERQIAQIGRHIFYER